ncbi:MAG: hypothetical protein QG656_191, partial [Candidatus Hydrogenedentes bacterium]|nr:hypothetical protein [Candidatus Hydrogenedentota bacterium]
MVAFGLLVLVALADVSPPPWLVWTQNNWLDVGRTEMPETGDDIARMAVTALVNEYESANFVISNRGGEALRLRLAPTDLEWFPPPVRTTRNVVENGGFDGDADGDGFPDGWKHVGGDRARCRLDADPERGKVVAVDGGAGGNLTLRQDLSLDPSIQYTLEFWARSVGTSAVQVGVIDEGWTWSRMSAPIAGTTGWHRVRVNVPPPASPRYQLVVYAPDDGSGTVWLDDIQLLEDGIGTVTFEGTAPELSIADWEALRGGGAVADALVPLNNAGRLDIPAGESRQVWMAFRARDLPPGPYECAVLLQPLATGAEQGAAPGKRVIVALEIRPLRIETHADFAVYNWDYAQSNLCSPREAYMNDLTEHKVNLFLVPTPMSLPEFDATGAPLGGMDFSNLDSVIRLKRPYAVEAGGQLLFSYGMVRDFRDHAVRKQYGWAYLDEAWVKAFRWAYGAWLAHLKALDLDYGDFCVQVWDEAAGADAEPAIRGAELMRAIDPKVRLVMDGAQTEDEVRRMDPVIDVWIPHLSSLEHPETGPALLAWYKSLNEPVYTYTCATAMKALPPYAYYRLKLWQAARLGVNGVFYWNYNSWRGDPWNDFDGEIADCGVVYIGIGGPVSSRRWEASREGIEDWQILRLAERLGGADAKPVIDNAIEAVLAHKNDPALADTYRIQLIESALEWARREPLE